MEKTEITTKPDTKSSRKPTVFGLNTNIIRPPKDDTVWLNYEYFLKRMSRYTAKLKIPPLQSPTTLPTYLKSTLEPTGNRESYRGLDLPILAPAGNVVYLT